MTVGVNFMRLVSIIIAGHSIFGIRVANADENPNVLCRAASSGCGRCLSAQKDCVWCLDPNFEDEFRCGTRESFKGTCSETNIASLPNNEIQIVSSQELGAINLHSRAPTQLQPNEVRITIRPGIAVMFTLKYRHMDSQSNEVYLLNSDIGQGAKIDIMSDCPESRWSDDKDPRGCEGVSVGDVISYNITLTLVDCELSQGDFSISIGVSGLREILGAYVTPVCGCECEKLDRQEIRSEKCSRAGNLICGKCMCHPRKSGKFCEMGGAITTTMAPMDNQCRQNKNEPDCSSRGSCIYGKCICSHSRFYGTYCECDNESCPRRNNLICSGNGQCDCGSCRCFPDWTGEDCSCSQSQEHCMSKSGRICNDAGECVCGACRCNPTDEGAVVSPTCELWSGYATTTMSRRPEPEPEPDAGFPTHQQATPTHQDTHPEQPSTESTSTAYPNPFGPRFEPHPTPQTTTAGRSLNPRLVATKTEPVGFETVDQWHRNEPIFDPASHPAAGVSDSKPDEGDKFVAGAANSDPTSTVETRGNANMGDNKAEDGPMMGPAAMADKTHSLQKQPSTADALNCCFSIRLLILLAVYTTLKAIVM